MSRAGTGTGPTALMATLLFPLSLLPSLAAEPGPGLIPCAAFRQIRLCSTSCHIEDVRELCCRCYDICCPDQGEGRQALEGAELLEDREGGGTAEQSATRQSQHQREDRQSPGQLLLAPKSAGFLSGNFQPVSAPRPRAPPPTSTCVETGFPEYVRSDGSIWLSLARSCQVLKCKAGVTTVYLDTCKSSSEATASPTPSTAAAAATEPTEAPETRRYRSCEDPSTGRWYGHGTTWHDESVACYLHRCEDGAVQPAGFSCPQPDPEPDPAVSDPAVSEPVIPRPAVSDPVIPGPAVLEPVIPKPALAEPDTSEDAATAAAATDVPATVPPLVPRPAFPVSGDAEASCLDDHGQRQSSGNVWTAPSSPCLRYHCQNGVVLSSPVPCPPLPPGCISLPPLQGQCCPSVACPQRPRDCSYDGRAYRSGAVFADDRQHPCQQKTCDDGLVVALGPPIVCPAVYCTQPDWPEGVCCKTCPVEELPEGLEELKQLVLKLGRRVDLPDELMARLEDSAGRLVTRLAAMMVEPGVNVTLETMVGNLMEIVDIINAPGDVDSVTTDTATLLSRLRVRLHALVDRLRPSLTEHQLLNANIDIDELVSWLAELPTADAGSAANILTNDLTRLLSGLLLEPGCTDSVGTVHAVDTLFVDDPGSPRTCYVCAKLSSGVAPLAVMNLTECGGPPPPGCTARLVPNSCCPRVQCAPGEAACRDVRGQLHPHGSIYVDDPQRPCVTYNCSDGSASVIDRISCMPTPPGCSAWYKDGFCCPKSDCPEPDCKYGGRTRDHGTSWPEDPLRPCVTLTCLSGRVTSEDASPRCPPPPEQHCVPRQVDYQCCPEYDCVTVNCTYIGQVYREGQTWPDDERYPCKRYSCTRHGTEKVQDLTGLCRERPNPACTGHRVQGQCCKQWICPQCLHGGRNRSEGDIFWDNPARRCAQMICQGGQPRRLTPLTSCPPVPEGCRPQYAGTSCCHVKYSCPACMFDPQGNFIEIVEGAGGDGGARGGTGDGVDGSG